MGFSAQSPGRVPVWTCWEARRLGKHWRALLRSRSPACPVEPRPSPGEAQRGGARDTGRAPPRGGERGLNTEAQGARLQAPVPGRLPLREPTLPAPRSGREETARPMPERDAAALVSVRAGAAAWGAARAAGRPPISSESTRPADPCVGFFQLRLASAEAEFLRIPVAHPHTLFTHSPRAILAPTTAWMSLD